ncbi:MAG: hypothetical protein H7276_01840 [Caulobacter sp.]|nr:hypothetical protein [Vitreoscilla sp.]
MSLKQITAEHWGVLLELLREEGLEVTEEVIAHGVRFRVALNGADHVLIHRYNTGSFLMQGKQYSAYGKVVAPSRANNSSRRSTRAGLEMWYVDVM